MATDVEKVTKDLYAAYNAHDIEKFLSLHTDDIFYEQVVAGGVVTRGKEEYAAFMKSTLAAIPDSKFELTSFYGTGDHQCEEAIFSGTLQGEFLGIKPTGKSVSFRMVLVRDFREGKTRRLSIYYDMATFMQQLGVLPETAQK